MGLPDYFKIEFGTAIVLGEAGASGVTHTLSVNNLADGTARMSVWFDLGSVMDEEWAVMAMLVTNTGTAPTAQNRVDVYLPTTYSTGSFPGGVTGNDGAWPSDSNEDEWAYQLGSPALSLINTNDADVLQTQAPVIWRPAMRYGVCVIDNNLGQGLRNYATPSSNPGKIILMPRRLLIQDTA